MGELGRILELLDGAVSRYRSVSFLVRETWDRELASIAWERMYGGGDDLREELEVEDAEDVDAAPTESVKRVWFEPPGRVREESSRGVSILDGTRWWSYDEDGTVFSNENDPEVGFDVAYEELMLLDPAWMLAALRLEAAGTAVVGGRAALCARGTAREVHGFALDRLAGGCDAFEVLVDAERGIVLRFAGLIESSPCTTRELTDVVFDGELPPSTFEPVAGAPRRTEPAMQGLSIEEAARHASFTVWAPPLPVEGWDGDATYHPGGRHEPETVWIAFTRPDATHRVLLLLDAGGADPFSDADMEPREHAGREVGVREPTPRNGNQALVRAELDGTRVTLVSESIGVGALLDVLDRLRPVGS